MRKLIHVIDKEGDLRENIVELLEMEGFEVRVKTPLEAKNSLQDSPDLVLINAFSFKAEAGELIQDVKSRSNGAGVQILVLSPDTNDKDLSKADALIPLPFTQQELVQAINEVLILNLPQVGNFKDLGL